MQGRQLGHYRILERLGAGGMGEVYRAHDDHLDRDVAIKLLPAESVADPSARARLLREARAAAALNHPGICTIHEVGEAEGHAYIAMELIEGRPLSEWVSARALPIDEVLRCGSEIADALAHAHLRQIVHRDLKSANVILTAGGHVKVLDFGLAKRINSQALPEATTEPRATLTEPGALAGTLAYMSPEQLRGEPADARSDVWALGVVLYELAVGNRPFVGQSGFDLSARILNEPPSPFPAKVPIQLRAVIDRCLAKTPSRRYQRASEIGEALEAIRSGTTTPWSALAYRLSHASWLLPAVAAVVVIAVIAAANLDRIRTGWLGSVPRVDSLAVLPLENLSGDAAQDYFADGMTEGLSTDLARLRGLRRVTARGSVIRYKGTTKPLSDIARELNVDALVTGSILRSGDRISITAQLLDPATGDQLWSNRYERHLRDVLVLRNEIVSAIVREIGAQLSPGEQARLATARQVNPEAYEAYLKGRFHWLKQTPEDFDLAERYYEFARDKDPESALPYAGLATVWFMRGDAGLQPPSETFPKATEFMTKALALDDSLAELYVALGNTLAVTEWDAAGSEREYRRAIALNPNLADAHFFLGDVLMILKRPEEWQQTMQRGFELDPLNEFHRTYYGWQLNYQRRYDEAIPIFQQLLTTGPNKAANHLGLWGAYHRKGMYEQALAAARAYSVETREPEFADALGSGADLTAYRAGMARAGEAMAAAAMSRHVPAIRIARMFAHAGNADQAMHWLEKAYENRESPMLRLGVFWDWLDLHGDSRFQDLLRRMKLPL